MKNKNLLLILLLVSITLNAQTNGRVTYKTFFATTKATKELRKTNPKKYEKELEKNEMAKMLVFKLDFNQDESLFSLKESLISEHANKTSKSIVRGTFSAESKTYLSKQKDTIIYEGHYIYGDILSTYKASFIDWAITKETKTISGYKCYKATYTYMQKWGGRTFARKVIAWFSPKIPLPYGPLIYNGLPGLILELTEGNRGYVVNKIKFTEKDVKIKIPTDGEVLTQAEVKKRIRKAKLTILNKN